MLLQRLRHTAIMLLAAASCAAIAAPPAKNKPPTVTLTSPANGATFTAPATIQLAASPVDTDGTIAKVEFFRGTQLIATVTAAPYTYSWANVAAGSYSITAKATDNAGATGTSAAAAITVSGVTNAPPTVSLTSPANGASFGAPATIQLSANAADSDGTVAKVEFFRGGTTLIGTATAAPYTFSWANVGLGTYSITAKATDNAGGTATSSTATVNVVAASTLTTITSPTPTSTFDWPITDVSGTFSGPADTTVLVNNGNNSTILSTITGTGTFVARNVLLSPGSNTLTATAVRRDGTSSSGTVTVDVPQRLVVLTSPTSGGVYEAPPSVTFEVSTLLSSGTIQRVDYFRTFVGKIGTATTPPYSFVWNSPPKGTYNVYAWMVDDKNVGRQSQEIQFTVIGPNVPPTATITSPANNAAFPAPASFTLQASAAESDGAVSQVEFLQDGQLVGTTNTAPYSYTATGLAAGTYTFTVRATDDRGATGTSAPVSVSVVPNTPPSVSLATSAPDAVLPAPSTVTFTATVADGGAGVGRVEFYSGADLIGTVPSAPFTFTWPSVPAGTYTVTARAYNSLGGSATSAPVTVRLSADAALLVDAGIDGSVVNGSQVIVTGRVAAPANSGVGVNGELVAFDRNAGRFSAVVPLEPGANTLTFVLSTEAGLTTTQTITVTRNGTSTLSFAAAPNEAFVGERVDFELKIASSAVYGTVEFDINGDGGYDFIVPASGVSNGSVKFYVPGYSAAGVMRVKARLIGAEGNVVAIEESIVEIVAPAAIDGFARGLWTKINNSLAAGNIAGALVHLTPGAQTKYGPVFNLLQPNLPAIVAGYSPLKTGPIGLHMSEYMVNSGSQGFFVYFVREADGVWRLESM